MDTPIGPSTALLLNGRGVDHPDAAPGGQSFEKVGLINFSQMRVEEPQPWFAGSQPFEQSDIGNIGDGLLARSDDGLPERQPGGGVRKDELKQAVGVSET